MRALGILLLAIAASCGGGDRPPKPASDHGSAAAAADDQARFDADRRPDLVVKALGLHPGARVADIGAGTGRLTIHLARAVSPGGKVTATDVDARPLQLMTQRLTEAGLQDAVEARVVEGDSPGLEPATYDAILLAEVDNYFTDPVAWLRAAMPALKPGGRLVIDNRIPRRAQSLLAAKKAGLVPVEETNPTPTHFLAVFVAPTSDGSGTLKR